MMDVSGVHENVSALSKDVPFVFNISTFIWSQFNWTVFLFGLFPMFLLLCLYFAYLNGIRMSGLHKVYYNRTHIQCESNDCCFSFDASYRNASFSAVKCTLKSKQDCHVQAFWKVPMDAVFELLHSDWANLKDAITTHIPHKKFSTRCACANDPVVLLAEEEKEIEFKPPECIDPSELMQESTCLRNIIPFVVLMVLEDRDELHDKYVVAMATFIHLPDKYLDLPPHMIAQYLKLSSGAVGNLTKIYLASGISEEEEGDTTLCLICCESPVSTVFLPCRHACCCFRCFEQCKQCIMCRGIGLGYLKIPTPERSQC